MNDQQINSVKAFLEAIRTKRLVDAREILTGLENDASFWQPSTVGMRADLLVAEGHFDQGIKLLTDYMASGKDVINGCLDRRARIYFEHQRFRDAKRDYMAILNSTTPHAVTYFHATAAYRIAWMLALDGDASYTNYLAKCPQKDADYFFRRLVKPDDIHALYAEQRTRLRSRT